MNTKALTRLTARQFENLVYDLLVALGLRNAAWRTPGRDAGRDIEGEYFTADISGSYVKQKWYIECKKYKSSVSWPTVREKLSYAEAQAADCLFVVTTSTISPQCLDQIEQWNHAHSRPQIRHWGRHELSNALFRFPHLLIKYRLRAPLPEIRARAFLDLSKIALKYIYSAHSASVFDRSPMDYLETASILSDLITQKLSQLESTGVLSNEHFHVDQDSFEWIKVIGQVPLYFDTYTIRAIIAVARQIAMARLVTLCVVGDHRLELSGDPSFRTPTESQEADLRAIASWGDLELEFDNATIAIVGRNHI